MLNTRNTTPTITALKPNCKKNTIFSGWKFHSITERLSWHEVTKGYDGSFVFPGNKFLDAWKKTFWSKKCFFLFEVNVLTTKCFFKQLKVQQINFFFEIALFKTDFTFLLKLFLQNKLFLLCCHTSSTAMHAPNQRQCSTVLYKQQTRMEKHLHNVSVSLGNFKS